MARRDSSVTLPLNPEWLLRGDTVKVRFACPRHDSSETIWVEVTHRSTCGRYLGELRNTPAILPVSATELVAFGPEHVLEIYD